MKWQNGEEKNEKIMMFKKEAEMKKIIMFLMFSILMTVSFSANTYEYKRELREGARGKWENLRLHLTSGDRLGKELKKVNDRIDKNVSEIQQIENLLYEMEKYKVDNGFM